MAAEVCGDPRKTAGCGHSLRHQEDNYGAKYWDPGQFGPQSFSKAHSRDQKANAYFSAEQNCKSKAKLRFKSCSWVKVAQKCCSMQGHQTLGALGLGSAHPAQRSTVLLLTGTNQVPGPVFPCKNHTSTSSTWFQYPAIQSKLNKTPKQWRFCHLLYASHKVARGRLRGGQGQGGCGEAPP